MTRCLNLISHRERKNKQKGETIFFGKDTRNNHLSNKNHKILAEQVMNFFLKNLNPVPGQFKGYHEM